MDTLALTAAPKSLTPSQIEDLRLAASKMNGVERWTFQAESEGCTNAMTNYLIFISSYLTALFLLF